MKHDDAHGSTILTIVERDFASLIGSLRELIESVPPELLYRHPPTVSIGENILKSAGIIEQTCGGLTVNLWDDPFEWTLPEALSDSDRIVQYIGEVDQARQDAFISFGSDAALTKLVSLPTGEARPLLTVLTSSLVRAADYRGRAINTFKIVSDKSASRFII